MIGHSIDAFRLIRLEDESGVSGLGLVAEGVRFAHTGKVVLSWRTRLHSTAVYDDIRSCIGIHGHGGKSRFEAVYEHACATCGGVCWGDVNFDRELRSIQGLSTIGPPANVRVEEGSRIVCRECGGYKMVDLLADIPCPRCLPEDYRRRVSARKGA